MLTTETQLRRASDFKGVVMKSGGVSGQKIINVLFAELNL